MTKHAARIQYPVVLFTALFLLLAGLCVYLQANRPLPAGGPDAVAEAVRGEAAVRSGALADPNREVRGLWIPSVLNITYPSRPGLDADTLRAELDDIVRVARENNLNTLCLQVRPSSDALYCSALFPTSAYLSGEQGEEADSSFDPLAYLCEIASDDEYGEPLSVYAWVNPLRVTAAGQDPGALSEDNPAVQHPEWTFSYNGAVYYNAGIPAVRALIAAGVEEICRRYPVAGVIFDDYFYPYPVADASGKILEIDDGAAYAAYGADFADIGDFRRDCVNEMVRVCYKAVKEISPHLSFGIAPFGIWQNDDGTGVGSATSGLEAFDAIYCDALAWMDGGYVDFIAPQIYWQFTTKAARYDTLVRWWNAQCDARGVPLWISHAIYNYESWNNPGEMRNQIGFARAENAYRGSLFYGYPQLKDNTNGVADEICDSYEDEVLYFEVEHVDGISPDITVTVPYNHYRCDEEGTYLLGQSHPSEPLFCNGHPVSRTRSGYFSFYVSLENGENRFVFTQGGEEYVHTVWKNRNRPSSSEDGNDTSVPDTSVPEVGAVLENAYPSSLTALLRTETLAVSVKATAGSSVTAYLGDMQVALTEDRAEADGCAVYRGELTLPDPGEGTYEDLGALTFRAAYGEEMLSLSGGRIYVLGDGAAMPIRVERTGTQLKVSATSWYYDDYIPASAGMEILADRIADGYAEISLASNTAYLEVSGIAPSENRAGHATFGTLSSEIIDHEVHVVIPSTYNVPVHCVKEGDTFRVTLYRGHTDADGAALSENPILSDVSFVNGGSGEGAYAVYTFSLHERDRFYGFRVFYESGAVVIALRCPIQADMSSEMPLLGQTIVLDAGHGGTDSGTLTPGTHLGLSEKQCNLAIVAALRPKLEALGARVILLREDDSTVDIYTRMDCIDALEPSLLLSIHQNSMPQNTDISHIRGVVGLYWTESGRSLADCVAQELAVALGRLKRETTKQRLAMLRNYKFPAALVEIGFVTSAEEFETLTAPGGWEITADAIARGVLAWVAQQQTE